MLSGKRPGGGDGVDHAKAKCNSMTQSALLGFSTRSVNNHGDIGQASSLGPTPNSTPSPLMRSLNVPLLGHGAQAGSGSFTSNGSLGTNPLALGAPALGCGSFSSAAGSPLLNTPSQPVIRASVIPGSLSSPSSPASIGRVERGLTVGSLASSTGKVAPAAANAKWTIAEDDDSETDTARLSLSPVARQQPGVLPPDIRRVLSVSDEPLSPEMHAGEANPHIGLPLPSIPSSSMAGSPVLLASGTRALSVLSMSSQGPTPHSSPRGAGSSMRQEAGSQLEGTPTFMRARPPSLNPSLFANSGSQSLLRDSGSGTESSRCRGEGGPLLAGATEKANQQRRLQDLVAPQGSGAQLLGVHQQGTLITQVKSPTSPIPNPYDSEGPAGDTLCCSLVEQHLRLSPLAKGCQHNASAQALPTFEGSLTDSDTGFLFATFAYSSGVLDLTTKVRLGRKTSARAAKVHVVDKVSSRYGLNLDPEAFTLKLSDASVFPSEYVYGDSPLENFAYVCRNLLAGQGVSGDTECCRLQLIPIESIVDLSSVQRNPGGTITVLGKSIKLRRRSTVGTPSGYPGARAGSSPGGSQPSVVSSRLEKRRLELRGGTNLAVQLTHRHVLSTCAASGKQATVETTVEELFPVAEVLSLLGYEQRSGSASRYGDGVSDDGCASPSAEDARRSSATHLSAKRASRVNTLPPKSDEDDAIVLRRENNSFSYVFTRRDAGRSTQSFVHQTPPQALRREEGELTPKKRGRSQTMGGGRRRGFTESGLVSGVRGLVSKKKIRFKDKGYDLDLTYITDQIIAMGFPSLGTEAYYRNKMEVVENFFLEHHSGSYKIYNLCEERTYGLDRFKGSVARYPFFDHCPPPFNQMLPFCRDVEQFLSQKQENVVSIHCKAGKGRTGTMISAHLLYSGQCETADDALEFFGQRRTSDGKGVTIPSQIRYVHYFARLLRDGPPRETAVVFQAIRFNGVPRYRDGGCDPYFTVHRNTPENPTNDKLYDSRDGSAVRYVTKDCGLRLHRMVVVRGDVQIQMYHYEKTLSKSQKMFQIFFNTSFLPSSYTLHLPKPELDKAAKDKDCKYFDPSFSVDLVFQRVEDLPHRTRSESN